MKALEKEQLKEISDAKVTKKIRKGEALFEEGEKLNGVFCVRNGASKLSKLSSNGRDQIVKIAGKGEVLGQRSVITEEATNLSAVALNDMEVCFIPKESLSENLTQNKTFAKEVILKLADDLKSAHKDLVNMGQKTVKQRIVMALLYLDSNFKRDAEGYIGLRLTRSDIADIVGAATEACIRVMTSLKSDQLISTSGKKIRLENKEGLQRISEGL